MKSLVVLLSSRVVEESLNMIHPPLTFVTEHDKIVFFYTFMDLLLTAVKCKQRLKNLATVTIINAITVTTIITVTTLITVTIIVTVTTIITVTTIAAIETVTATIPT